MGSCKPHRSDKWQGMERTNLSSGTAPFRTSASLWAPPGGAAPDSRLESTSRSSGLCLASLPVCHREGGWLESSSMRTGHKNCWGVFGGHGAAVGFGFPGEVLQDGGSGPKMLSHQIIYCRNLQQDLSAHELLKSCISK